MKTIIKIFTILIVALSPATTLAQGGLTRPPQSSTGSRHKVVRGEKEFKTAHQYYQDGEYETAAFWMEKSANLGHAIAQNDLGLMHQYGIGVDGNSETAVYWYEKAKKNGYKGADFPLSLLMVAKEICKYVFAQEICKDKFAQCFSYWSEYQDSFPVIYFPENDSKLRREDKLLIDFIIKIIKEHPYRKFIITGYHDNCTGTDETNTRIRHQRTMNVVDYIIAQGGRWDQFDMRIDPYELTDLGARSAPLDRAVTIRFDE